MTSTTSEIDALLALLRTDDPPIGREVKNRVVSELRTKDRAAVLAALWHALEDADAEYRCTAGWVSLVFDFEAAIPHIRSLLVGDPESGVKGYFCQILGASKRREAVPLLLEVLRSDADGTHRWTAAWGLGVIGDPAALPALTKAMQNDEGVDFEGRPVKEITAEAIRRITQDKAAASVA